MSGCFRQFSAAELDDARAAHQTNYNYRSMNCGRGSAEITILAGTSKFQHALAQAGAAPRPWRHQYDRHLPAVLACDPDDRLNVAPAIRGQCDRWLDSLPTAISSR